MKISYKELQEYFTMPLPSAEDLAREITMHAFEVESVEKAGEDFILDINVLPDRADDCGNIKGIVEEISAILGLLTNLPESEFQSGDIKINFTIEEVNKKLGSDFSADEIENVWERLKWEYLRDGESFNITVPADRPDITGVHDILSEIARLIGYDKVKDEIPKIDFKPKVDETTERMTYAREHMIESGYGEVMTYTFRKKGDIEVAHGVGDKSSLRTNLSDGLKDSYELNMRHSLLLGMKEIKIFEIGTVFLKDKEEMHVGMADKNGVKEWTLEEATSQENKNFTALPSLWGLRHGQNFSSPTLLFKMWSLFPYISRDVALWVEEDVEPENVTKVIKENMGPLVVRGPELFDQFKKEGKKSLGFRLVFQAYDRTLSDEEVNKNMEKVQFKLTEKGWTIR